MATDQLNSLQQFYEFVGQTLKDGGENLSPEYVLALWRERLETIQAIQRGIDDVNAGRSRPFAEFAAEFERKRSVQAET